MTLPMPPDADTTLSHHHAARLATAAGLLYTIQASGDDVPAWVRIAARDALGCVDDTRQRDTAVAMARTHIAGEVPKQ